MKEWVLAAFKPRHRFELHSALSLRKRSIKQDRRERGGNHSKELNFPLDFHFIPQLKAAFSLFFFFVLFVCWLISCIGGWLLSLKCGLIQTDTEVWIRHQPFSLFLLKFSAVLLINAWVNERTWAGGKISASILPHSAKQERKSELSRK